MARKSRKHKALQKDMDIYEYKVGIYARISYANDDQSIKMQVDLMEEYVSQNIDMKLVEIYSDESVSSFNSVRPSFVKLLDDVRSKKINCVIVRDFSRFGRDYIQTGDFVENIFPFMNVRFISLLDRYDSNKEVHTDFLINSVKQFVNYYYSADLSRKVSKSLRFKMSIGEYNAPKIPYGYEKYKVSGKTIYKSTKAQADIVRDIYQKALTGESIYSITKSLNQRNVDGRNWTHNFVKRILSNKFYIGTYETGKVQSDFRRRTVTRISQVNWHINENHHETIIDNNTFYEVEKILNKQVSFEKKFNDTQNLFRGKLYCGDCNRRLKCVRRNSEQGYRYSYICPTHSATSYTRCSSKHITERKLKAEIKKQLEININKAKIHINKQLEYEKSLKYQIWHDFRIKNISKLKTEIERLPDHNRIMRIMEEYIDSEEDFGSELMYIRNYNKSKIKKIKKEIDTIETELLNYEQNHSSKAIWVNRIMKFKDNDYDFKNMLDELIDKVVVFDDFIEISWKRNDVSKERG